MTDAGLQALLDKTIAEAEAQQRELRDRMLAYQHEHWRRRTLAQWKWEFRWARWWLRFILRRWLQPIWSRTPDWKHQESMEWADALCREDMARRVLYGHDEWPAVDTRTPALTRWLRRKAARTMTEEEIQRTTLHQNWEAMELHLREMGEYMRKLES